MSQARLIAALEEAGVIFEAGLTDTELEETERYFGFRFPPDLATLLQEALPVSHGFVDWRRGECPPIRDSIDWPFDGICRDIEENGFWIASWGPVPASLGDRFRLAGERLASAPKLIPICGHRFIPERPHEAGNPVFSVYQGDVLVYGMDLTDYLQRELDFRLPDYRQPERAREIELWSQLAK